MLNNRKLVSTGLVILGSMTALILLDIKSSQAEVTRYRSRDGSLTIRYEQCSTTRVFGSYQVGDSTSGILTAQNCMARGDTIQYQFRDETGGERCYGRVTFNWGRFFTTTWEIDGAVRGYQCSQTGKRFEIQMIEER